jgi:Uma2 family endonuclease
MSIAATKPLTAEEFFELPEPLNGVKQELVKGVVVEMPAPGFEHGEIQLNIASLIKVYLKSNPSGRVVTESGVRTEHDEDEGDTVRGPDVSYYSAERLPLGKRVVKYHDLPPDLCVEVVSPSNTKRQLRDKIQEYFAAGVRMVWRVDPEDRSVTVLTRPDQGQTLHESAELTGGDVLPGFSCRVAEFFE